MDTQELREEFKRLTHPKTIQDCIAILDKYSEYFFSVITNAGEARSNNIIDKDARIVSQMMFVKILNIKRVIEGIDYKGQNGIRINTIVDPTIIASLIRNVYETVTMFHLIYLETKNTDERTVLYSLWVMAGLNYRQRFATNIVTPAGQEKLEDEQKTIDEFKDTIAKTTLFQSLSDLNKKKIETMIKDKDYKMSFEGTEVKFHSWQQLAELTGCKKHIFENIYTYFSLYSHPSNVAVFQFADMFKKETEEFKVLTITNMSFLFILLSIFIADYIKVFPKNIEVFEKLTDTDQILINHYNILARDRAYSINDSWKKLG